MRFIIIFTILLLLGNTIVAEDKATEKELEKARIEREADHRKDLLEQLLAPAANERVRAAIELQPLITQKELEKWFYGYDERYREDGVMKNRHVPHDWLILVNLLSGGWPDVADFLQDAFLEVKGDTLEEGEYLPIFAGYSYTHKKFKNIDLEAPINTYIQDEFYEDYVSRISYSMLWEEKYQYIASTPWLKERFLADKEITFYDKIIVKHYAGELTEEYAKGSNFSEMLYKAATTGEIPQTGLGSQSGLTPRTDFAFIIANLLGKTEWFKPIQESLRNSVRMGWIVGPDGKEFIGPYKIDLSNNVFEAIIVLLDNDIKKCKEILEEYLMKSNLGLDPRIVIHHSLFKKLRDSEGFEEWFKDLVTRFEVIDPDPTFKTIDWWNQ